MEGSTASLGLLLTGGGARTAYQVGVLQAMAEWLPADAPVPFAVICGTSGGAINAAMLGANAHRFRTGTAHMAGVWRHLRMQQVLKTDALHLYGRALRWAAALLVGGLGTHNPRALFDASPLRALVERHVNFARLDYNVRRGTLRALSVTATGYASGRSISFVATRKEFSGWRRARRIGLPATLTLEHILASAALPFLFEAVPAGEEYCGDGALRDLAPLSAPIHLGADRILVISTRDEEPPMGVPDAYPTLGRIAGTLLDALFSDSLRADLERLRQINQLLRQVPTSVHDETGRALRPVRTLVMAPSEDPRAVALAHLRRLPRAMRSILRGLGAQRQGSPLASYLLFDGAYCGDLIALGRADAQVRREAIRAFLEA